MPNVNIYQVPEGKPNAGMWTFSVDGVESKYYCPTQPAAARVVRRLNAGLSQSLGSVLQHNDPVRVKVHRAADVLPQPQAAAGGAAPPQVKGYCYELDGQLVETVHRYDTDAKAAGAWAAFMSRGRLAQKGSE